ncbi:hypothetical protein DESC_870082 [Desulfosarcina cetonica]|uniref:hypothetical protein n=1 Tax=Desulfosarcina cetonica TaxID=90730 RepID=UPI0006CF69B8|nr:hypothetical protein [Desulfosarcina cetonica]VTR70926.1 hypothetical protein DESC_870082 [Desulfosarcina cetonica]
MTPVTDARIIAAVEAFFHRPDVCGSMDLLRRRLPDTARIGVAGGALRNLIIGLLHGSAPPTRDIDLFVGGVKRHFALSALLRDQPTESTGLGGLRWRPPGSAFVYDLCLLPNFVVIKTFHLGATFESLLASIDFTVNAILYDDYQRTLTENGCIGAIRHRMIDFNSTLIPGKCLIAYRMLLIGHKTGFAFARPVYQFLKQQLDPETLTQLKRVLRAKVGKVVAAAILAGLDALCRTPTYEAYLLMRGL